MLRQTERVRLLFRPMLVQNDDHPKACIKGEFVYERKSSKGLWEAVKRKSLAQIRIGEEYKLELHSGEILSLMEALGPLYRLQWAAGGLPIGRQTYVKVEAGIARLLRLNQAELESLLDSHPAEAASVLGKLLRWVGGATATPEVVKAVAEVEADRFPRLGALLGLAALKAAETYWLAYRENPFEPFWQDALARYSFVLSQLFAHPVVIIKEQAYLGGKALDDTGGSYIDFLAATESTDAVALIEVKTPATALLGPAYRTGAFPVSKDIAGAIAQVLKYRHTLATSFATLGRIESRPMTLGSAPCIVIAGNAKQELKTLAQRESFEAFRGQLSAVRLVTYDELFAKVGASARLLEGIT